MALTLNCFAANAILWVWCTKKDLVLVRDRPYLQLGRVARSLTAGAAGEVANLCLGVGGKPPLRLDDHWHHPALLDVDCVEVLAGDRRDIALTSVVVKGLVTRAAAASAPKQAP